MEQETYIKYLKDYLHLIALYLNKKEDSSFKIDDDNLPFFVKLSKMHSTTALLYKAVKETKADIKEEYLKKLEEYYLANIKKHVLFEQERKELYEYLEKNHVLYLPLKGIILKDYYSDPYTREFADNDIFFGKGKDEIVKKFFVDRGYEVEQYKKSNHDVYKKKPCLNFEMHRALFGEMGDNKKIVEHFRAPNIRLVNPLGLEAYFPLDSFYVYFTAHTYKHFHIAGCGLRTLVDYYVFLKKCGENDLLDFERINKELNKIDLVEFSNSISSLSLKVFDEQELSKDEMDMLLYIASSGTYGTLENAVSAGVKKKGKFGYFMSRIFPPVYTYKTRYPWAYKCRILLPIAWMMRTIRIMFTHPKRATAELKMIAKSKEEKE